MAESPVLPLDEVFSPLGFFAILERVDLEILFLFCRLVVKRSPAKDLTRMPQ
jgi:hypothetical protein